MSTVQGGLVCGVLFGLAAGAPPAAAQSATCEVINYSCEAAASDAVARAGRSTVMLRFPGANQCTGTLVNNGRNDERPFILTARHCAGIGDLVATAATVEIVYRHEQPCGGGTSLPVMQAVGAIHRATHQDAWLIEALEAPPLAADVHFAGLNASTQPGVRHFGVHQGNGRAKQFVEQQLSSGNIQYIVTGMLGLVASTWHTNLVRGSTPFGSSGSALFDAEVRVVGTLSTGAICAGDVIGNDYQQLAAAWDGGGTADSSLRPWLDPDQVGFRRLDGRWPGDPVPAVPGQPPAADAASGGGGGTDLLILWGLCLALLTRRALRARHPGTLRGHRQLPPSCPPIANPCLPRSTPSSIP